MDVGPDHIILVIGWTRLIIGVEKIWKHPPPSAEGASLLVFTIHYPGITIHENYSLCKQIIKLLDQFIYLWSFIYSQLVFFFFLENNPLQSGTSFFTMDYRVKKAWLTHFEVF